jgi:hypothetical protein
VLRRGRDGAADDFIVKVVLTMPVNSHSQSGIVNVD